MGATQMKKTITLLTLILFVSGTALASTPDVNMDDLPSSATLEEGIDIGGTASGENLDEISIRVKDPDSTLWTTINSKNCEGLPDCSISTETNYSPDSTGEKDFSIFIDDEDGDGAHTEPPQTVDFTDGTQEAQLSVNIDDLTNTASTGDDLTFGGTASGENLNTLTIKYREENSDWQTLEDKNCGGAPDCSIDQATYSTNTEQNVDFKAVIEEESGDTDETDPQTVEFVDSSSIDSYNIDDLPETKAINTDLNVGGTASGNNLDTMEILVDDGDGYSTWEDKNCNDALDCSIERDYHTSETGDVDFKLRVHAGNDEETTDPETVSFEEEEELNNHYVDDIAIDNLPNQQLTGEDMEIGATTTGRNLESLEIKERTDSGWETYEEKDCHEENACSIDITDYEHHDEEDVDFKAVAKAGTGSDEDRKETDVQTVEFVDEYELEADFDYHPSHPDVGETVDFESTSHGDIEEWTWDFGDGNADEGENVEHSFDEAGEYIVELEVSDGDDTDDRTRVVEVGHDDGSCDIDVGQLELDPETVEEGDDSTASIEVENDGDAQDITVSFEVNDYLESEEDDVLSSGESETYSITLNEEHSVDVRATVETDSGGNNPCSYNRWDKTGYLNVVDDISEDGEFNFEVEDEDGDELDDVKIEGENGESFTRYTDNDGETSANVQSGEYEITASKPGYDSQTKTRDIDSGETRYVDFTLERDEDSDQGELEVLAEDIDEDPLENVEITAENGDDETEDTDENGLASFYLEEGDYTVTAEKDGYHTQSRDVDIEEGERTSILFEMIDEDEESVRISDLDYDDTVCRGDTLTVTVSISNSRDSDELVTFRGEGLGSSSERYVVTERGETITRELRFTNVEGSGTEEFDVYIDNSVNDHETGEVEVENCGGDTGTDAEATGLTAEVNPRTIQAGETVNIRGFVDGIRGATEVEISANGRNVASTSTDRTGYYSTYTRFNTPGTKSIDIEAGGLTRTRNVEVLATATVGGITGPNQVFESEEFELCADISSQTGADVVLLRNGDVLESKNGNGEVCFETEAGRPGTAIYEVRALTSGEGDSSTKRVEVLEQGNEVESFPDQLASVESGGSIAKVELYNTNDDLKTYELELTGIDQRWYSQSDDTVHLSSGERETVYFYLTPRAEGEYRPTLRVDSDGRTIYDNEIILETEGTTEPQTRGFFERFLMFLGF